VEHQLADLLDATGDKELVGDVKEFLGVGAQRHGRPEQAKKLLPSGWEKEDPRTRLRDMKKRFEAKYKTPPDGGAAPQNVGPVPQPGGEGPKPGVKEEPGKGLPPLEEEANTSERVCRERLKAGLRPYADANARSLYLALDRLRRHARDDQTRDEDDEEKRAAEVAGLLGRELEPSERILVGVMRRQGKSPNEMADVLRRLPAENPKR